MTNPESSWQSRGLSRQIARGHGQLLAYFSRPTFRKVILRYFPIPLDGPLHDNFEKLVFVASFSGNMLWGSLSLWAYGETASSV